MNYFKYAIRNEEDNELIDRINIFCLNVYVEIELNYLNGHYNVSKKYILIQ